MPTTDRLLQALSGPQSSTRLRAAMTLGTYPDSDLVPALIERCAVEPDFYVRDMLTWALTRHAADVTIPLLLAELAGGQPQARSQALHTLSKIGAASTWSAITHDLLTDPDPETAKSAWRAAVVLVPDGEEEALAAVLASQLGRGDEDLQHSLSRALVALGEMVEAAVEDATRHPDPQVVAHALATQQLLEDPDSAFTVSVEEALRLRALASAPQEEAG
ncbi:HEAT repeat domain-containing protein [Ruania albidiflava]|uniref:HEAT repeat domain-containing protein n=1 Tax=Ruania albidiflava TaxID=366586 RepID=UPI0023F4F8B7|nr:HEAT repeat domain-containing protein [Ruania albidiflava]